MWLLTLKVTAERIARGTTPIVAIKEHIDCWRKLRNESLYLQKPKTTGDARIDAWLAAAAHHEAMLIGEPCPDWPMQDSRFLAKPFCPGSRGMQLFALVDTPLAFRMRNVFTGATSIN